MSERMTCATCSAQSHAARIKIRKLFSPDRQTPALHKHIVMSRACDQPAEGKDHVLKIIYGCGWIFTLAQIVERQRENIVIDRQTFTEKVCGSG